MAAPDPVDIRLLSLVAESGKAAVHDIAARLGMDPREVATRLINLSAAGLPLIVGVECDPYGLRNAISSAWSNHPPQGPYPPRGYPAGPPGPSGPHPVPPQAGPPMAPPPPPQQQARPDPMSTWGPPQSSSWARGDQPTRPATWTAPPAGGPGTSAPVVVPSVQRGHVGDTLHTDGTECEPLAIQLVELVDPADFLFTAAGYRLREGERAVVVHTEVTNQGNAPFTQLADLYLVLVAKDGQTVGKAPVSLSSRPPHRIGVRPGETTGGHTVYVLPDATELTAIRWTFRPDDERGALTWDVEP
ncbi:MAG TPA: AsnC family protein [Pseudonocardiaceae bacterium]|nr:AsnC family protein [Pseudonocardiaceae bacterium]